jgi:glycolate oxidase
MSAALSNASRDYFVELLGEKNVIFSTSTDEKLQDYLKDMADYPSQPLIILRPESTEQVSEIVVHANETRTPIVARGAGTSLTGASSAHGWIVLDFTRMKKILKIDTVNWYAHVEAGVVLEDLNEIAKKSGFFFPPDPGSTPWCTFGGAIAENSGGMRCFRYGTVKDWVWAVKVVLADGSIVKFGEPLPKNRVGYDFVHLICGSEGTLGLITEAWVKLAPLPQKNPDHKRLYVYFPDWLSAGRAIQKMRENRIQPVLLEFMDRATLHSVNEAFDLGIPEGNAILFIETDSGLNEILKICEECGSDGNYIAKDEADEERLYSARMLNYMGIKSLGMSVHTEDVAVPIDKLVDYLQYVANVAKKYGLRIPTGGHAGDGNVHPSILYDESTKDTADRAFADICNYAIEVGGTVTGEHGVGEQKIEFAEAQLRKSNGPEVLDLMRQLKKQWDPNNILNPGKFFTLEKN